MRSKPHGNEGKRNAARSESPTVRSDVRLTEAERELFRVIGEGNMSLGIQRAALMLEAVSSVVKIHALEDGSFDAEIPAMEIHAGEIDDTPMSAERARGAALRDWMYWVQIATRKIAE